MGFPGCGKAVLISAGGCNPSQARVPFAPYLWLRTVFLSALKKAEQNGSTFIRDFNIN
jgi:hypothetical protein